MNRKFAMVWVLLCLGLVGLIWIVPANAQERKPDPKKDPNFHPNVSSVYKTIAGNPLTAYIGDDGSFQIKNALDPVKPTGGQFYHPDAIPASSAFFVQYNGSIYGPSYIPYGNSYLTLTKVSQTGVSGDGSGFSPFQVTTTFNAPDNTFSVRQIVSYRNGSPKINLDYYFDKICTNGCSSAIARFYFAADLYFQGSDAGYGYYDPTYGVVGGVNATRTAQISFIPRTPGSKAYAGLYYIVWDKIGSGSAPGVGFNNTNDLPTTGDIGDNGAGLEWDNVIPNATVGLDIQVGVPPDPGQLGLTWAEAIQLNLNQPGTNIGNISTTAVTQKINAGYGSRWFKFTVPPKTGINLTLSGANPGDPLPADYDLAVYKDISAEYNDLIGLTDLEEIAAKAAPLHWLPLHWLPLHWLDSDALPLHWLDANGLPLHWLGKNLPLHWLPPDKPNAPDAQISDGTEPDGPPLLYLDLLPPSGYKPAPYALATALSLFHYSIQGGTQPEVDSYKSYDNEQTFYVRVANLDGKVDPLADFRLEVQLTTGPCATVGPVSAGYTLPAPTPGNFKTVLLTDTGRLQGTAQEKDAVLSKLNAFATRSDVRGKVINLADPVYQRVIAANQQADSLPNCVWAKNQVATEIKAVIDSYRGPSSSLQYVVLAGNDTVIPFYRYVDKSGDQSEDKFEITLGDNNPSSAAIRGNHFLSQDFYGATQTLDENGLPFPILDLAVGRLVEKPAEIINMLDAFVATNGQVTPSSSFVSGYDFVADVANQVSADFTSSMSQAPTTLINNSWTAQDLRNNLLSQRYDMVFLAGHFSAGHAEPAYSGAVPKENFAATELLKPDLNLQNSISFSVGCHSGFNLPDLYTSGKNFNEEVDWPQVLARKGATSIIGTGFQYGDDFGIDYSERLYLSFSRQLHTRPVPGTGPTANTIGQALSRAKNLYVTRTANKTGEHQKVYMIATLYGLPMLKVTLQGRDPAVEPPIAANPTPVSLGPGASRNLSTASYTMTPQFTQSSVVVTKTLTNTPYTGIYLAGGDGTAASAGDPILPLEMRNVAAANQANVIRGVGFRGGTFTDIANVFPLTSNPVTEYDTGTLAFGSPVFYPTRFWGVNYEDALAGGIPRLVVAPAQFKSNSASSDVGTLRRYDSINLKLYYSSFTGDEARANTPSVISTTATINGGNVSFSAAIAGATSPIQDVWVTYYFEGGNVWQSLDLNSASNNIWTATLTGVANPENLRYVVQVASAVGMVGLTTNNGEYYRAKPPLPAPPATPNPTSITIITAPGNFAYNSQPPVEVELKYNNNGTPAVLANQAVSLDIGGLRQVVTTDASGRAKLNLPGGIDFPVTALPGDTTFVATYLGNSYYQSAVVTSPVTISKIPTTLAFSGAAGSVQYSDDTTLRVTLKNFANQPLVNKPVILKISGGTVNQVITAFTDSQGQVALLARALPVGSYSVQAYFSGNIPGVGQFDDPIYAPASVTAPGTLTVTPEDATVAYTGSSSLSAGYAQVVGQVTQASDGSFGNLELAQVRFDLRSTPGGAIVQQLTADATGSGIAKALFTNLIPGTYYLTMQVSGDFFTGPESPEVPITIVAADCLLVSSEVDTGANVCSTLTGAINYANNLSGSGPITISVFGVSSISAQTVLPTIQNIAGRQIILDGGNCLNGNLPFEISRANSYNGLGLTLGNNVTLRCVKISGFVGPGITAQGKNISLEYLQFSGTRLIIAPGAGVKLKGTIIKL